MKRIVGDFLTLLAGVADSARARLRRPASARVRRRRLAAGMALVAALVAVEVFVLKGAGVTSGARDDGPEQVPAQLEASKAMADLAGRIGKPWVKRRSESGLFVDPITGGAGHGYGPAMLAEALIRDGARRDDRRMLRAGLAALEENTSRAANDDAPGNPLELFAVASAYRWAERNLSGDPDWERRKQAPQEYLERWEFAQVGEAAQNCFASPTCWNNYKIVDAAANLLLLDTGLEPASEASLLADPKRAKAAAISVLERDLANAIGRKGEARGRGGTIGELGLLADEPTYPLAYHAMSVAALARALRVLGDEAPPAARENFRHAMLAGASFMAPDGDIAYMGRAQGESWALGATAYAGEACADMFQRSHPRSAGMCATLAMRSVDRLRRLHKFHEGLMPIVPRLGYGDLSADGLEHYARVMTFNGLTAVFLEWGSEEARAAEGVEPVPLPLARGGSFVDPDRAHLAVVRRGGVWFAVHAVGPKVVDDLRYDFGLLSLKVRKRDRWVDVQPPRPFNEGQGLDSGGPTLVTPAGLAFPQGERFSVESETGEVVVRGGFRTEDKVWVMRDIEFRYKPARRGVTVTVTAPPGSQLRYQDFLPEGWTEATEEAAVLQTPTAQSRLSETPSLLENGLTYVSSYAALRGFRRYVTVPASGQVSWKISARPMP
ncbi:MAG: hypothetical protein ACR2L8_13855 [Solirubrobacteraceae bacterium]